MTDRDSVLADLLNGDHQQALPAWKSSRVVTDEGLAYLDYGDADHTYRVTVTAIPRRHLHTPDKDIAAIDGIGIRLVSVVISNDTTVVIDAQDGPSYRTVMAEFRSEYELWEQAAERPLPPPPDWPANKVFGCVRLSDDAGTAYVLHGGRAGGPGTEFECTHTFDPAPPDNAQHLQVDILDQQIVVGTVSLDL